MQGPKKVKHRKSFKGRSKGFAKRGTELAFGKYGLKALERHWLTARQLEAARKTIMRNLKKKGKLWIRVFPDKPITSKGVEFTMGGGKGTFSHYVYPVKPGRILFELTGVEEEVAKDAFKRASFKLPVKTKFISREE
ncbi:MAG: 50S ribosomal protein L16 [Candidatus Nealsonbacteria bacterium]|nr:50S ribosomal protein L16 [Candidatus Nealsonbacteria bacterium]